MNWINEHVSVLAVVTLIAAGALFAAAVAERSRRDRGRHRARPAHDQRRREVLAWVAGERRVAAAGRHSL
jgi:hypothetical protein